MLRNILLPNNARMVVRNIRIFKLEGENPKHHNKFFEMYRNTEEKMHSFLFSVL